MLRRQLCIVATLAVPLLLASCGGGSDSSAEAAEAVPETTTLVVDVIPIPHVAPLYLALEKGYFADEGLTVEPNVVQNGAAAIAALTSGSAQIGFLSPIPVLLARNEGVEITMIAAATSEQSDEEKQNYAVLVPPDSPIKSAKDLAGKTVAVNALLAADQVTTSETSAEAGIDPASIKFTAIPYPDMVAALESGHVDAAMVAEPFYSQGLAAGLVPIAYPNSVYDGGTSSVYAATDQFVAENEGVVDAFVRALTKASDECTASPDECRVLIPSFTRLTDEQAASIRVPVWTTELDVPTIERLADLMVKYSLVDSEPDVQAVVPTAN